MSKHKLVKRKREKIRPTVFLTEARFDARYLPIQNSDGSTMWEHEQTLSMREDYVWSILDIDGDLFAVPGYAVVNVVGYHVTTNPWPHSLIEVRFDGPDVGLDILS